MYEIYPTKESYESLTVFQMYQESGELVRMIKKYNKT